MQNCLRSKQAVVPQVLPHLLARIQTLREQGGRRVLGIIGAPGSGKSTLAAMVAEAIGAAAVVVPMDGFHLAQIQLRRLALAHRKGAPDTFDVAGYIALLQRIRSQGADETIYAPLFERTIEEPIAGALCVPPQAEVIITEGNYLLSNGAWSPVRDLLDESWYIDTPEPQRAQQILGRHMAFGRSREEALAWIEAVDAPNARVVMESRERADVVVVPERVLISGEI